MAALTLFVLGPQAGSFDDDGDGSPDIPVVVSDPLPVIDLSEAVRGPERSSEMQPMTYSCRLGIPTCIEIAGLEFSILEDGCALRSCSPLRC
jgi:hypothetical protein